MVEQVASTRPSRDGYQVIDVVVDRGYRPGIIHARAGIPIRLVFHRRDDDPCFERVVFSPPRLDRHLAPSRETIVELPAQAEGQIRFTCGMGRYRGRVEVVDSGAHTAMAAIRRHLGHLESPIGTAFVLWLCSLPLIVLVAVLALDATGAVLAAAAALVAWVAGCLWAFDRSTPTT